MAEKDIIVRLSVEGGDQAAKQIDQAAGATKNLATGTKEANTELKTTAKELSATASSADNLNKTTGSLRSQLKSVKDELQKLALAGKANTAEYKKLREEAGQLQDAISDVSDEIRQAGSDTRGLDQTIRVATTAASAFAAVQAATALFGQENEELQKTLVKVTAAISLVQSLQQIQGELLRKDSVFTLASAKAKGIYAAVVGTSTGALKAFRIALIATGFGAIIAGIGLLVANWEKLTAAFNTSKKALDDLNASLERNKEEIKRNREESELRLAELKAAGATEKQLADQRRKDIADEIAANERIIANVTSRQEIEERAARNEFFILNGKEKRQAKLNEIQKKANEEITAATNANRLLNVELKNITNELNKVEKPTTKAAKATFNWTEELGKLKKAIDALKLVQFSNDTFTAANSIDAISERIRVAREELNRLDPRSAAFKEAAEAVASYERQLGEVQKQIEKINRFSKELKFDFPRGLEDQIDPSEGILQAHEFTNEQIIQSAANTAQSVLSIWQQLNDRQRTILEDRLAKGLITEEQYQRELATLRRKEAAQAKVAAVFQATINLAAAISAALAKGANVALAAVVAALAGAQLAAIIATPIPKFRRGGEVLEGMIRGNSHERGGVVIEAEGGEYIMNKNVTGKYRPIMEALNAGDLSKVVQLSLPILPRTSSGGSVRMKDKRLDMMLEEMQYISSYIQQGNRYGKEVAVNTGRSLKTRRHNV